MSICSDHTLLLSFVEESRDHLATLENELLRLEVTGDPLPPRCESIHTAFRAIHSMKGCAGYLGLKRIASICHEIENILSLLRSGDLPLTSRVLEALLEGGEALRTMVADVDRSEEMESGRVLERLRGAYEDEAALKAIQKVNTSCPVKLRGSPIQMASDRHRLDECRRRGKQIYLITIDLVRDLEKRGRNPLEFLKLLLSLGEVLDCCLDVEGFGDFLEGENPRAPFSCLFASVLEPDLIPPATELESSCIVQLSPTSGGYMEPPEEAVEEQSTGESPRAQEDVGNAQDGDPMTTTRVIPAGSMARPPPGMVRASGETFIRIPLPLLDHLMDLSAELMAGWNQLLGLVGHLNAPQLSDILHEVDSVATNLMESLFRIRLQPIGTILGRFPRAVRNLAQITGKKVNLEILGEEVELDKSLLEQISDPITHLIRNAIDHGIEPPQERERLGKPPEGKLVIRAYHRGGQVRVDVSDDGRGIDFDRVKEKAVEMGAIGPEEIGSLPPEGIQELLFLPGFSTAESISAISGRGVGLDAVFSRMKKMGGSVAVDSEKDRGTTVTIQLPFAVHLYKN